MRTEYTSIRNKIRYYDHVKLVKELDSRQQSKYDDLVKRLKELEPEHKSKRKYANKEEYVKANRERSKQRYLRLKDDEEYKAKMREYAKDYYHKHKAQHD